jgi:hypothetical protein
MVGSLGRQAYVRIVTDEDKMRTINDILTREMIIKEPMGKKLDAWVAEFVMEWRIDE